MDLCILSIIGGIICICFAIGIFNETYYFNLNERPIDEATGTFLLSLGISSILWGIIVEILFSSGAEIIRLLKKLNGLKYEGTISQPLSKEEINSNR